MKKYIIFTISAAWIVFGSLWAYAETSATMFFVFNQTQDMLDVRLGRNTVEGLVISHIGALSASRLTELTNGSNNMISIRTPSSDRWQSIGQMTLPGEKVCCLLIQPDYSFQVIPLEKQAKAGINIVFFNGTDTTMARMEVGASWNSKESAFVENVAPGMLIGFRTIAEGSHSVLWQPLAWQGTPTYSSIRTA